MPGKGSRWGLKPVSSRHRDALSELDWKDFEKLLAGYFRDQGYAVEHCGTGGAASTFDGGVDLRLERGTERVVVQCKHQNAYQVPHNDVNQLIGIKINEGATGAIIITSGEFTAAAQASGAKGHIELIDGVELRKRMGSRLDLLRLRPAAPQSEVWREVVKVVAKEAPRHFSRRRREKVAGEIVIKLVAMALLLLFLGYGMPRILSRALLPPSNSVPHRSAPPEAVVPGSVPPAPNLTTYRPTLPAIRAERPETSAERAQREAELKAYLERVPEVTKYRYSPLDRD